MKKKVELTPIRFCLKKIGEPSSIKIKIVTIKKMGDNKMRNNNAITRFNILMERIKCFN
jgi:hypothetical protein